MRFSKVFHSLLLSFIAIFLVASAAFSQIDFIENKGQWDKQVKFLAHAGDASFFLENNGFTVLVHDSNDLKKVSAKFHAQKDHPEPVNDIVHSHAYKAQFINTKGPSEILPDKALPTVNNYFIGDKSTWAAECKIYKGVTYKNVYPNIDVRYYADAAGRLKYDLIVKPGGNPASIALKYSGADKLEVKNKELLITTSVGVIKELYPYSYQVINNKHTELDCRYIIEDNVVRFKVKDYDPTSTLVIDPTQIFFTYVGSTADNWGFTATYGPDGSFFSGGISYADGSSSFPASPGAFQTSNAGGTFDIAIMKLSPDGTNRIYATYIGGSGSEQPHSLFVDPQGNLVIAGRTNSANYPVKPANNIYGPGGRWDIIVTKLNAAGNALIGSIKIGGTKDDGVNIVDDTQNGTKSLKRNYGDDARSEVIIDGSNNIYVASSTQSADYKTSPGAIQTTYNGGPNGQDGVVIKLSSDCSTVLWNTLLGGTGDDGAYVLALGNNNNLYVAGGTGSIDFPEVSSSGVIQSTYSASTPNNPNPCDGFLIELSTSGTSVLLGTYLGTDRADQVYGVQTDKNGFVYVMGTTEGNWSVINAAYQNAGSKQFIAKIKPDLSAYVYSTVFGNGSSVPNISPTAFLVDRCENVYVSGWGGKANTGTGYSASAGNVTGMPVTTVQNPLKTSADASGSDFYFFVLQRDALSQLFGGFFGQADPLGSSPQTFGDHVDGGTSRFDRNGIIYQAMCANCNKTVNFTGTPGSWSPNNQANAGALCNLGMLKIEMNFAGVAAGPQVSIDAVPNKNSGCTPLLVTFTDTLQKGKRYIWDFGDGSPRVNTTTFSTSHTYVSPGRFTVMLIAIDSTTCNIADTAYTFVKAGNNKADLGFNAFKLPPCTNLTDSFVNTSSAALSGFGPASFIWDFGDGTPRVRAGLTPSLIHTYAGAGTYKVKLYLEDTTFCNSPDSVVKTIRLSPNLRARFDTPPAGCVPYNSSFDNTSLGGLSFIWDFGDPSSGVNNTSTLDNPTHLYNNTGTYTIKLYAFDSTSCNKIDSTAFSITVFGIPTASFTFSPNPPKQNTFTNFTNQSIGATKYLWRFGDGDSTNEVDPRHLFNATGTYSVCLNAANVAGCSDDTCMDVSAIILPLLDVPNAFTPGKNGINSVVKVQGFGIKDMQWTIYNRWGQKVFESTSVRAGWDGTFKGKIQAMDVYTYTLDVVFSDGKKLRKTGDISLLR